MMNRRNMLSLSGVALVATTFPLKAAEAVQKLEIPALPYAEDALAPVISARTVGLHYNKHHKSYYEKLNGLVKGTPYAGMTLEKIVVTSSEKKDADIYNNAAQAWNHNLYWQQFAGGNKAPTGKFAEMIQRDFGGIEELKTKITGLSEKVFGTGWVWLARNGGKLDLVGLQDAGNPMTADHKPLLGIDVWEHAYYLDYENRRPDHVRAVLDKLVNWEFVGKRFDVVEG